MRVFMLGWEFPPFISGGLGTACYGLTRGLDEVGVEVCFVLPTAVPLDQARPSHVQLRSPSDVVAELEFEAALSEDVSERVSPEQRKAALESEFQHLDIRHLPTVLQAYGQPGGHQETYTEMVSRLRRTARSEAAKRILRDVLTRNGRRTARRAGAAPTLDAPQAPQPQAALPEPQGATPEPAATMPRGSFVLGGAGVHYEGDLISQVRRYADLAVRLAIAEDFDVVHAHDWMTYPAAIAVAEITGKPLVVHVHSTEFDRSGEHVNQKVYDIERAGMHKATKVVCVSHLTEQICRHRYGVDARKTTVVYNAVDLPDTNGNGNNWMRPIGRDEKIVLFLGRVTMQKGPEYFLMAAKKVVEKFDKVRFVMAGSGDMIRQCIQLAADLKIGRYVTFTGFLRGADVGRIFDMADLYVMPSVSEPFGIAPLEALSHNVPAIISKQSGVSEVLTHVLKVDFWDTDEMANKILAVLRHEPLQTTLREHGKFELQKLSWHDSAEQLKSLYTTLVAK